jgi:hypothetical protein
MNTRVIRTPTLKTSAAAWAPYIKAETLTAHLDTGEPAQGAYVEKHNLDGMELLLGVKRN